jgi:hypothetical protein
VGAYGDLGHLIHFRPKLGDKLVCTCPMVCLVNSGRGLGSNTVPQAVPLETSMLQYNVQCHISQAFVDLQLVCQFPNVSLHGTIPSVHCQHGGRQHGGRTLGLLCAHQAYVAFVLCIVQAAGVSGAC